MLSRKDEREKVLMTRAAFLGGVQGVLVLGLAGRMYQLQVLQAERYKMMAEDNRISMRLLPPPRGRILDRRGLPLADNRQNFQIQIVREDVKDLRQLLDRLSRLISLSESEYNKIIKTVQRHRAFVAVPIKDNLTWEEMARIQVNAPSLPGIVIDEGLTRFYPNGELGAHVLGYVAAVSKKDLTELDPLLDVPGFKIGKSGLEKVFDKSLRGSAGTSQVEVNAIGRVIKELRRDEGASGQDLHLTLDLELQKFAADRLQDQSAAAVLMDVHSGDLLVMASTPSYDPNAFSRGLSVAEWDALQYNPFSPLINKVQGGQFAPGSTFKMMVALAALDAGVIDPNETVYCPGHMDLGNNRFHCWKRTGHGHVNMVESLKYSCDVYYYEVAKRTGIDRIAAMARRFGLGAPTGIELPNEYSGLIPSVAWKSATYAKPWHTGETLNAGIGQGYVLATPLQLAVMVARIANGGYEVFPNLSHHHRMPDGTIMPREKVKPKDLNINPVHLQIVKQGMFEVVNTPRGTARRSALRLDDIQMAGKTGTAQVRRITRKERQTGVLKNNELPWRDRDHALFVAFAPYDKPQYAVAVVVEHGGGGSSVAAPIARDILEKTFEVAQHIPEKIQAGFLPADGALDRQLPPAEGQV